MVAEEIKPLVSIRAAEVGDKEFIFATWLRGLYYGNDWFQEIDKNRFMERYHIIIENILSRKSTNTVVACLQDEPSVVLGYSVLCLSGAEPILHWVHVKKVWRNNGIGRSLIPGNCKVTTHLTHLGYKVKPKDMKFDPFLI